jgi:hypothetical protein
MTAGIHEYREHIELAERTNDTLIEWIEEDGTSEPAFRPAGPVADVLTAMIRLFLMEEKADSPRPVPQHHLADQERRVRDTVAGLSLYPPDVRLCVAAPVAEIAETLLVGWIVSDLLEIVASPEDAFDTGELKVVQSAMDRLLVISVRMMIATDEWSEDFEEILATLYDVWTNSPPNDRTTSTLQRALLFHALKGRQELVIRDRRELVDDEPLPKTLTQSLARMTEDLELDPAVPPCLHLALVDALAAGLIPKRTKPPVTVASAFLAWARFDTAEHSDEDRNEMLPDVRDLARWARCRPKDIHDRSGELVAVFDMRPWEDLDSHTRERQIERFFVARHSLTAMPARWVPADAWQRPGTAEELLQRRLEELRDVAWMMVDSAEPILFVLEALPGLRGFDPEFYDAVEREAVTIWNEHKVVDLAEFDDDGDRDDGDDVSGRSCDVFNPTGSPQDPGVELSQWENDQADAGPDPRFDKATALALTAYYQSWLDQPAPALDGQTPREAVLDESLRPALIQLLGEIDVTATHGPGVAAHLDLSFLWTELGLEPER